MNILNENSGITQKETEALFFLNSNDKVKVSFFKKIKDKIEIKKSEKLLKTKDICSVLDECKE